MSYIPITPTMLSTASRCQMQVYWFHVERLRLPPGFADEYGKAFEKQVLSIDQVNKIATGNYLPLDALKEGIVSHIQSKASEIDAADEDVALYGGLDEATGAYCDAGVAALDKYNEVRDAFSPGPGAKTNDIQYEFNVPIADTSLLGRMDIHASSNWTKDVKTRSLVKKRAKRRTQTQVDYDDQFASYAYANFQESGNPNQTVEALYVYRHPSTATIEPLQTNKKEAAYDVLEDKAFRLHKILQSGSFYPVDPSGPGGWVCQEKYCGAWKAGWNRSDGFAGCPFGQRAQISIGVSLERKEGELK
jgi:hypothetical protein